MEFKLPHKLAVYEAILRRGKLSQEELESIQENIRIRLAGLAGEQRVRAYLQELNLPAEFTVLYNFQPKGYEMDVVILTPKFACVLEVKHMKGILRFDQTTSQFTRELDEGMESFRNPIDQVERHAFFLKSVINQMNINFPVYAAVVISNQRAIIANAPADKHVFHLSGLHTFLQRAMNNSQPALSPAEFKKFIKKIRNLHTPAEQWKPSHMPTIQTGVYCQQGHLMRKKRGRFYCEHCQTYEEEAVWQALQDYQLLIAPQINNRTLRNFLHLTNAPEASKLLKKLQIPHTGGTKNRSYTIKIPPNIEKKLNDKHFNHHD